MSYAIVTFINESNDAQQSISEVPITWLTENRDYCKWLHSNANIYINKNRLPAEDWLIYLVKIECICESLSEARKKITAMDTSSSDERGRGCRVIKPNNCFSPDESVQRKRIISKNCRISSPPYNKIYFRATLQDNTSDKIVANEIVDDNLSNILINTFVYKEIDNTGHTLNGSMFDNSTNLSPINVIDLDANISDPGTIKKCNWCKNNSDKILSVLSQQTVMIKELIQRVASLETDKSILKRDVIIFGYEHLPCQDILDLENLEQYIQDPGNYKLFCNYIQNIGGNSGKDFVGRFLKAILSNPAGGLCSWTGAKNNFKLSDLTIMKATCETLSQATHINKKEFEIFTKDWLRHCKQRRLREDLKQ